MWQEIQIDKTVSSIWQAWNLQINATFLNFVENCNYALKKWLHYHMYLTLLCISIIGLQCWVPGICQDILIDNTASDSDNDCLGLCQETDNCLWFTYDSEDGDCMLFQDCQQLDTTCETCVSGQRECSAKGMLGEFI